VQFLTESGLTQALEEVGLGALLHNTGVTRMFREIDVNGNGRIE